MRVTGNLNDPAPYRPAVGRRLAWLLACVLAGLAAGAMGDWLWPDPAWYLALPGFLALGWLYFADPSTCVAPTQRRDQVSPGEKAAR